MIFTAVCVVLFMSVMHAEPCRAAQNSRDFNWFWFFYEQESSHAYRSVVYRPFFMKNDYGTHTREASLMPFIYERHKRGKSDVYNGVLYFMNSTSYIHRNGVHDYDFGLFPILFFGRSGQRSDRYFMLLPVGGTLRGKLGQGKISAWVFPGFLLFIFFPPPAVFSLQTGLYLIASVLPVYSCHVQKDFRAHSVMFPLFMRGKGGKRDVFRLLPFYAHHRKQGWYDNYSVLMIFNYQTYYYRNDIRKTLFIFPFYGRKWSKSGRMSATTILWPFFSWGRDRKYNDRSYNLPWPLVQIQDRDDPKIRKRIFFPFYGRYNFNRDETFFLTPLYIRLTKKSVRFDSEYYINFLVCWYFKRDYHNRADSIYGKRWRYFKIWPLFHLEYNDLGDRSFNLLSLLPFRDPDGYEKLYQVFWSLVEYRRTRQGEKDLGLLFRTYYQHWGKDFMDIRVPVLITYRSQKNRIIEMSFLLSMFGYYNRTGDRYVRLFWIPVFRDNRGSRNMHGSEKGTNGEAVFTDRDYILYCSSLGQVASAHNMEGVNFRF